MLSVFTVYCTYRYGHYCNRCTINVLMLMIVFIIITASTTITNRVEAVMQIKLHQLVAPPREFCSS